jgi:hypothetical protein
MQKISTLNLLPLQPSDIFLWAHLLQPSCGPMIGDTWTWTGVPVSILLIFDSQRALLTIHMQGEIRVNTHKH